MTILSAQSIRARCVFGSAPVEQSIYFSMIFPFLNRAVHDDTGMSFGLSSASYDIRIRETIWVWPLWGRRASTFEHFNVPNDLMGHIRDKSSWARCMVMVQNTQMEPGWSGYLTLELTRNLPWPIRIKAGTPIAQVVFEKLDEPTEQPYGDGKYQHQEARPVPARREGAQKHWWYLR